MKDQSRTSTQLSNNRLDTALIACHVIHACRYWLKQPNCNSSHYGSCDTGIAWIGGNFAIFHTRKVSTSSSCQPSGSFVAYTMTSRRFVFIKADSGKEWTSPLKNSTDKRSTRMKTYQQFRCEFPRRSSVAASARRANVLVPDHSGKGPGGAVIKSRPD